MDPLRVTAELLFGLVFVFVGHAYLRRRDAISRDLVLAFAGLGLTFLVDVWRRVAGSTPPPIGIAVGVLLLLQPSIVLPLMAAVGYLIAFAPPASVARAMQASATVGYVRRMIEISGEPAEVIWAELARLATTVRGGSVLVIVPTPDGTAIVAATSDNRAQAPASSAPPRLAAADLDRLRTVAGTRQEGPVEGRLETLLAGGD